LNRQHPAGTIAVAALSARMMAEASARDGFDVVALDLFGDADTREAWASPRRSQSTTSERSRPCASWQSAVT